MSRRQVEAFLPEPALSPKGGRPPVSNHDCLRGILFVLFTGCPWQKLPRQLNCGSGTTCWRRFQQWIELPIWPELHWHLWRTLDRRGRKNLERVLLREHAKRSVPKWPARLVAQPRFLPKKRQVSKGSAITPEVV